MSEQFISAVTNEAMSRVCYAGGWGLKPIRFFISQKDVFDGNDTRDPWPDKNTWDSGDEAARQRLQESAFEYLMNIETEDMQKDYTSGGVWYNSKFSSLSKANESTITHHVVIPGDVAIDTASKNIRTIYFLYQDEQGQDFLYAIARCNGTLIFETGITQSFFFNFTVTNALSQEVTEFVLNYSCNQDIEDHNNTFGPETHSDLVARDGSRLLTGILTYEEGIDFESNPNPNQLVPRNYVEGHFVHLDGDEEIDGVKTFKKTIMGTAYRALSADIAEYYEADEELKPGTLIEFGGPKEITKAKNMVNGVVSTNPGYVLNTKNNVDHPTLLVLSGRVPVLVEGIVNKFDYITLSKDGVGKVDKLGYNTIGRALETNLDPNVKLVECVVQLKI